MVWYRPVAGAFDEVNARLRGESPDVLHGEDQRLVDEPMQNQSMLRRVNIRDAAVMALIEQTVWRDDAVEILQRRAARGRNVLRRVFRHMADDVLFVFGRCPVGLTAGRITGRLHPFGNIGRDVLRSFRGLRDRIARKGACCDSAGNPPVRNAAAISKNDRLLLSYPPPVFAEPYSE